MIRRNLSLEIISNVVCNYYDIDEKNVFVKTRKRGIVRIRQIIHYFACKYTKLSLADIGNYNNSGFDHATVINSRTSINDLYYKNKSFIDVIDYLDFKLKELSNEILDAKVNADIVYIKSKLDTIFTKEDLNNFLLSNIEF